MDIKEQFEKEFTRLVYNLKAINERWITIHPHGEDSEDYRRIKLEDGETPKEAIDRVYKKEGKESKKNNKSIKERVEEKRQDYDLAYAKREEVNREIYKFERQVDKLIEDVSDYKEIQKIKDKFLEEHKEEAEQLTKKIQDAEKLFQQKEEEFKKFKSDIADEIININHSKLNDNDIDKLRKDIQDFYYLSGIPYDKRKALQDKLSDIEHTIYKRMVKQKADSIGGYTKKLNDLCNFTNLSDISSYSEDLQKHIYENYKAVYDKYPQIKYGGISKRKLKNSTYAQNYSQSNRVEINSQWYDNLDNLKKQYDNDVAKNYHPKGTDYNSIIVHELGHSLQAYITKTKKITAPEIRERVLKKLGIKQKDVGQHLSIYAMAKPRKAHEFFAEAFAEYMTSKSPRPLAQAFGEEINRILNQEV